MGVSRPHRLSAVAIGLLTVALAGPASAAAPPTCFGAAARDAARPCENPALRFRVSPTPDAAPLQPNAPCVPIVSRGERSFCASGRPSSRARRTVALIGDSHAPSWRGAVEVAAQAEGWRLLTLSRSGCAFNLAEREVAPTAGAACTAWVEATLRRMRAHPEIRTVILAQSAHYPWIAREGGDRHAAGVAGARAAFDALPASVRRIVVVRDSPRARFDTLACVSRAVARHRRSDRACALPRDWALPPDAAADAARTPEGDRADLVDLSEFFCDATTCPPVVGGALVYKDEGHLTATFTRSLGPYFLAAVRALG